MSRNRLSVSFPKFALVFGATVLCALPAVFMNDLFGYFPVITLIMVYLVSFTYGYILSRSTVCLELSQTETCRRGEEALMKLTIRNSSPLVCTRCSAEFYTTDLFGNACSVTPLGFTLAPREEREFAFSIRFDHIGQYLAGLKSLRVDGLLGVISFLLERDEVLRMDVLPKLHAMDELIISKIINTESQDARLMSSAESVDYTGVREYAYGDSIKLIHWKLSSHAGSYVTKVLKSYGNNTLTVIPGLRAPDFDSETLMAVYDAVVECCASLCHCARENGIDAELLYHDKSGETVRQTQDASFDFSLFIESLPAVYTQERPEMDLLELLRQEASSRYSSDNIAVCSPVLDEYVAQGLLQLYRAGKTPIFFYIHPVSAEKDMTAERALRTLDSTGICSFVISSADSITKEVGA